MRAILLLIPFLLTGCQSNFKSTNINDKNQSAQTSHLYKGLERLTSTTTYNEQANDITLAEAALSVSQSLRELAEIQRSVNRETLTQTQEDPTLVSLDIQGRASIDWTGPVESLLHEVADRGDVKFTVLGQKPALPIIVSIQKDNTSLNDLIRDLSYMVQNQAQISFENNTIMLRYYH